VNTLDRGSGRPVPGIFFGHPVHGAKRIVPKRQPICCLLVDSFIMRESEREAQTHTHTHTHTRGRHRATEQTRTAGIPIIEIRIEKARVAAIVRVRGLHFCHHVLKHLERWAQDKNTGVEAIWRERIGRCREVGLPCE